MTIEIVPGLFGKIPVLGDFVMRGLPADFVGNWDTWLQSALVASKEQLGDQWLDIYLTSPIYRFVLSAGSCGGKGGAGILMPSVDRLGRYFPLTLIALFDVQTMPVNLFISAANWFDKLEELALSVLEDSFDFAEFEQCLQAHTLILNHVHGKAYAEGHSPELKNQPFFYLELEKSDQMPGAYEYLSEHLLGRFMPVHSLWSLSGSARIKPSLAVFKGLPPAGAYGNLLSGRVDCDGRRSIEIGDTIGASETVSCGKNAEMRWHSNAFSAIGKVRKINEDAHIEMLEVGLWAVADGMGGLANGSVASKMVVDALSTVPASEDLEALADSVIFRLQEVNARLFAMARKSCSGSLMGSTVVVLLAAGNQCISIWAGDSRLYRYRGGLLSQLTRDHSIDINSNVITRAVGVAAELVVDTIRYEVKAKDIYLLCSDGLFKDVQPHEIISVLENSDSIEKSRSLVELALEREAKDNITATVIEAEE